MSPPKSHLDGMRVTSCVRGPAGQNYRSLCKTHQSDAHWRNSSPRESRLLAVNRGCSNGTCGEVPFSGAQKTPVHATSSLRRTTYIDLCGDPSTAHEIFAKAFHRMLASHIPHAHLLTWLQDLLDAGNPSWPLCVRRPGKVGKSEFTMGSGNKEPDYATWPQTDPGLLTIVEIAVHNETASQLFWEILAWSQVDRGSAAPVVQPANALGLHVDMAKSHALNTEIPAFALCLAAAAAADGSGLSSIHLFNASVTLVTKWQAIIAAAEDERRMTINITINEPISIPVHFLTRWADPNWNSPPVVVDADWLAAQYRDALSQDEDWVAGWAQVQ